MPANLENSAVAIRLEKVSFHPIPKKGNAKECSNYHTITLISHAAAAAAKLLQSCPTLCDPRDGSPPGSPIPGILQATTLEWVAISFSRGSSRPRDQTWASRVAGRCFTTLLSEPPGKVACELSAIVRYFEHSLALPFFGIG